MRDFDIRSALRRDLEAEHAHDPTTFILDEMGVCSVRVDVAVVNGSLSGFEIKSDQDTLQRLPEQARVYSEVFDAVTIVMHRAHANRAVEMIPDWWGIVEARPETDGVGLQCIRAPRSNPSVSPHALVRLLWRDEVVDLLSRRGFDEGVRSKPRRFAWNRAAAQIPLDELRAEVRNRLKSRRWHWRADRPSR